MDIGNILSSGKESTDILVELLGKYNAKDGCFICYDQKSKSIKFKAQGCKSFCLKMIREVANKKPNSEKIKL